MTPAPLSCLGLLQIIPRVYSQRVSCHPASLMHHPFKLLRPMHLLFSLPGMYLFIFHHMAPCQFLHNLASLFCPSPVFCPCLYCNIYLNIWLPTCLSILLSHLQDCEPLEAEICVWFDAVLQLLPQCLPLDFQKCLGEFVNGWSACVSASKILGWWPEDQDSGHGPDCYGGGCLINFIFILKWLSYPQTSYSVTLLFSCSTTTQALSANLSTPKGMLWEPSEPSIWIELNHWQSYVPKTAGARGRLWGRAQTFSP